MRDLRRLLCPAFALALAATAVDSASAAAPGMCDTETGLVLVVIVEAPKQVAPAAADLSLAQKLVDTPDTVIFADGRAVTSDLAAVSAHLDELGWARRPIEIAGAGTSTRLPPPSATTKGRRRG
jgi:hypothetical protein